MKKVILGIVLLTNFLFANNYIVKYEGMTIGMIENLDTVKENYIKIKMDSFLARMKNEGKDYLILYKNNKPVLKKIDEDCNFQLDKEDYITLIKESINNEGLLKNKKTELKVENKVVKYFKDLKNNIEIKLEGFDITTLEVSTKTFWDSI